MADTPHAGTIDLINFSLSLHFIGQTTGIGPPFLQWESGDLFSDGSPKLHDIFQQAKAAGGTRTNSNPGTPGVNVIVAFAGSDDEDKASPNQDWFERVHALPKSKIEFGNIITQVEEEYHLHNAFRRTSVTLAAVVNNTLPGTLLPNLTPPLVLAPLETALDPATTNNGAGTGLGTIVQLKVQATADGLPIFDADIQFDFSPPANDVSILLSGQRIVLLPLEYEVNAKETLAWLTDIIEAVDGREQRIALRKHPRQGFEVTYLLDELDRQRMQATLLDWGDNIFGLPLWHERLLLTSATSPGATNFLVRNADQIDLRVGGLVGIIGNNTTFDVLVISAVTATQITTSSPALNGYAVGTRVVPVRTAILKRAVTGARTHVKVEEFNCQFEIIDNNTGSVAGSSTPGFWSTYLGRVLFDDSNFIQNSMREEFQRRVYRIDNETGIVTQTSTWDRGKRGQEKGFVLRNRADIYTFRKLLTALRGRQKAVWIPTFIEDLTVVANILIGTSTLDISNIDYTRFAQSRLPMKVFKITFTDNTTLIRSVLSSIVVSSTVERLTLDTTWPANRTIAEVRRIEFYELVRSDADEVAIRYPRIGLAYCNLPLMRVFDDN